jgi:hypothetical protein
MQNGRSGRRSQWSSKSEAIAENRRKQAAHYRQEGGPDKYLGNPFRCRIRSDTGQLDVRPVGTNIDIGRKNRCKNQPRHIRRYVNVFVVMLSVSLFDVNFNVEAFVDRP